MTLYEFCLVENLDQFLLLVLDFITWRFYSSNVALFGILFQESVQYQLCNISIIGDLWIVGELYKNFNVTAIQQNLQVYCFRIFTPGLPCDRSLVELLLFYPIRFRFLQVEAKILPW